MVSLGIYMVLGKGGQEEERAMRLVDGRGLAMIGLGISVSLDELTIGFSLGLVHVPVAPAVILIAAQANRFPDRNASEKVPSARRVSC
jgi:putative Mn2+ efflux pump MntP